MIRFGLRLTVSGGREALSRLVLIMLAVAVGSGLLLGVVAGLNAVTAQNDRYAWLETSSATSGASGFRTGQAPLLWRLRSDYFQGAVIGRVDVAATRPGAPVPPGIAKLPGPGQFYASPALTDLLRQVPRAELGARYPGVQVGTIGSAALPSPSSLLIVIGHRPRALAQQPDVEGVDAISTAGPASCNGGGCVVAVGTDASGVTLILAVVAAALLFPLLVLIGAATRLSAARREQRFAALRLVGATPRQIAVIATVESAAATVVGVLGGFGLFFALRPALARIPFTGERFFVGDLSLTLRDVLVVGIGLPVIACVVARLALRRVSVSPLGVTRRAAPPLPSAWRLAPLVAGLSELGFFAYVHDIGADSTTAPTQQAVLFLVGVLLVMSGLVISGPWLTMLVSRLIVRRAERPSTLIAARRLADNPKASFRAVSGVVLAVFVGSCASGIVATILVTSDRGGSDPRLASDLVQIAAGPDQRHRLTSLPAQLTTMLNGIRGVTGVAVIRHRLVPDAVRGRRAEMAPVEEMISCRDLARVPSLGRCPAGAAAVLVYPNFGGGTLAGAPPMSRTTWHTAPLDMSQLRRLPIDTVVVGTDGSASTVERARTALDLGYPSVFAARTVSELHANNERLLDDYQRLAEIVVLASLPIAGASLAVSIAGGLADRRRPFSLLRLSGTPLGVLRRVVGLEAAAPMLVTAAVSVGAGLLVAQLFLRAQLYESLQPPGAVYYVMLATGLAAALAIIASTLPLLNRMTGPEAARNE